MRSAGLKRPLRDALPWPKLMITCPRRDLTALLVRLACAFCGKHALRFLRQALRQACMSLMLARRPSRDLAS